MAPQTVPADVVARTEERAQELTGRMLRPRQVNVDVLWSALVVRRAFGIDAGGAPDPDAPAKMLEMWRPDNACYLILEAETEQLGAERRLSPVEFNLYFEHIAGRVAPCLDEQWPVVDPHQFFSNPESVRADRVTVWFDSIWQLSESETLTSLDHCRDGFYAHMAPAASAVDSQELEGAWSGAMVEFSGCRLQAIRDELPFMELAETGFFAFELNDRYTLIALQTTVAGHLVGVAMQRPYDECWPEFEASIPEVALATGPAQLVESRDAALRAFSACIEVLPEHNPFAGQ